MRKQSCFIVILTALAVLKPGISDAVPFPLTQFKSANYLISASGFNFLRYDAFQPNLQGFHWQIERVRINVIQNITLQVATLPNFVPQPPFGLPSPLPYSIGYRVEQEFSPLSSLYPAGFSTIFAPNRIGAGLASGAGGITNVLVPFNYELVFDNNTDLIGGLETASSGLFGALREDFLPTPFSDDIYTIMNLETTQLYGQPSPVVSYAGSGSFLIQYDGTLFLENGEEPPAFLFAVPVALPLPILAIGFAAVCLIGRRRYGA